MSTEATPTNKAACPQCGNIVGLDDFPDNSAATFFARALPVTLVVLAIPLVFAVGLLLDLACMALILAPVMLLFALVTGYRCRECHLKVPSSSLEQPQKKALTMRRLAHLGAGLGLVVLCGVLVSTKLVMFGYGVSQQLEHEWAGLEAELGEDAELAGEADDPFGSANFAQAGDMPDSVESDNPFASMPGANNMSGANSTPGAANPFGPMGGDSGMTTATIRGPAFLDNPDWLAPVEDASKQTQQPATKKEPSLASLTPAQLSAKLRTADATLRMRIVVALAGKGPEGLAEMTKVLGDPESPAVKDVLAALGQMGDRARPAVVDVAELVSSGQTTMAIRREALRTLSQIDPDQANNLTFTLTRSRDASISNMAAEELKRQVSLGQTGSLAQWVRALSTDELRPQAVTAIENKLSDAQPLLVRALAGAEVGSPEAIAITQLLMKLEEPPAEQRLAENLMHIVRSPDHPDATQKQWATRQLGRLGSAAVPATPLLLESLNNLVLRDQAEASLIAIGAPALPAVIDQLGQRRASHDAALIRIITGCAEGQQVELLLPVLEDPSATRRAASAAALGELGPDWPGIDTAVPALAVLLTDANPPTKRAAARSLSQLGGRSGPAVEALVNMLISDPMYSDAAVALVAIGQGGAADTVVPRLAEVLSHANASVRIRAGRVLGQLGPHSAPAAPQLAKMISDAQPDCRRVAIEALGSIGPAAKDALPALQAAAGQDDTRAAAERAVAAISAAAPGS